MKKHIPNALTCLNLVCGCLAIVACLRGDLAYASYLVFIAAVLDFLDGFAARMLKVYSEIGKQLDSLADMVTFGVVPGMILLELISRSFDNKEYYLPFIALLVPVFSALRLAKFNIDTRQTDSFIGVPTPANAMLVASFPLILFVQTNIGNFMLTSKETLEKFVSSGRKEGFSFSREIAYDFADGLLTNPYFYVGISILMSFLMVSEIKLFALKFKNFDFNNNRIRYIFLGISALLLIIFKFVAIPFIVFLYIILSVFNNATVKNSQ